jgi:hypothetical protein
MEINKKAAPQRAVLEISRTGGWGKVVYAHRLECRHTEYRKRALTTKKIACTLCAKAEVAEQMVRELIASGPAEYAEPVWTDEMFSDIATLETDIGNLRASMASALQVSADAVDVVSTQTDEGMAISYVVVFFDAEQADRIARGSLGPE